MLASAGASFGHKNAPHDGNGNSASASTSNSAPAASEQTPWGMAGDAKAVQRTLTLRMDDAMRFTPNHIEVREGDTVRLRVINQGKLLHETVLGTQATLKEHAALMQKFPTMEHDAPYMAHVAAGGQGDIVWQFNRPGQFDFACLIDGHYQAGMTGTITVLARKV